MKKTITLLIIISFILLLTAACKKTEEEEENKPKNSITYAGNTYEFWYEPEKNYFIGHECPYFAPGGGIMYKKVPGITLLFYNRNVAIFLELFGESAGTYKGVTGLCNENIFKNTSMVYSKDGLKTQFISASSELVITKKSNSAISGNFKIIIGSNQSIIQDSIITGTFENIPLTVKI